MSVEQLTICPADDGRYAVRPVSWAGIWGKSGLLASECKSIAYFDDEQDAKDYIVYHTLGPVEELSALVKARDEGRVVVLPCKVGTKVWVTSAYGNTYNPPKEANVVQFVLHDDEIMYLEALLWMDLGDGKKKYGYATKAFGRAVFLTRAEAEAALGGGGDG